MDDALTAQAVMLRNMESGEAADWLMEAYPLDHPDYGNAFRLLRGRSWQRADQFRLARYYLQKAPFASATPYEALCSIMAQKVFLQVMAEQLPASNEKRGLLRYHLEPLLLRLARSEADREEVEKFVAGLS